MKARVFLAVGSLALAACEASVGSAGGGQRPVLEFPEAGIDDPAAYDGYTTRFFRDAAENTVQVYLNNREGRVVHVWADAANESAALSVHDASGDPVPMAWGGPGATVGSDGANRTLTHRLETDAESIELGWFLLGTMRQERDLQYSGWHRRPFGDPPFILPELTDLIDALERLPDDERTSHLAILAAADAPELRDRLEPVVSLEESGSAWTVTVEHTSLDGRNHMTLVLEGDAASSTATLGDDRVRLTAVTGGQMAFDVTVRTDSPPLTPLGRDRLFNAEFEAYFTRKQAEADSLSADPDGASDPRVVAFRRLERQVLGLELLSSEQKLMASLPNYATYFGRDQMMSALMLAPISSVDLQELVIASVLGKIAWTGNVSHEEALGGQAIREAAADYASAIEAWEGLAESNPQTAGRLLEDARGLLRSLGEVRENYRMVDDDFQLAVLADRYLSRDDVPADRKREFLLRPAGEGRSNLEAMFLDLAFVANLARPYARDPSTENLVGFFHEDDNGWLPGSWRDSRAGYGNGRYAMDVNVVWVPQALASLERILAAVDALGLDWAQSFTKARSDASALAEYLDEPTSLRAAVATWEGARRHFEVRLDAAQIRRRVGAALASLPPVEHDHWIRELQIRGASYPSSLTFLALALDGEGRPIEAVNSDPATDLFLGSYTERVLEGSMASEAPLELVAPLIFRYPVGLFVDGLGPVVVNDAYASDTVRQAFRDDLYHSPRVVWGREVNLLLLGLARQIEAAYDESGQLRGDEEEMGPYVSALRTFLAETQQAVEASGLGHNELWSYRIEDGELRPVRYGQSSDIQLWNVTDLAVSFLLDRLPAP